jgi:hypothetical protein
MSDKGDCGRHAPNEAESAPMWVDQRAIPRVPEPGVDRAMVFLLALRVTS